MAPAPNAEQHRARWAGPRARAPYAAGTAKRFADHLRGGRRAQKLASAAGGGAGATSHLGRVFESDLVLRKTRADGLHLAGIFAGLRQECDAAGNKDGGQFSSQARAIIIAGSPLSQVAMPMTPFLVGSERISRRNTIAASLRKGRESSIPVVPWVRPSQGSVQAPAKGMACRPSVRELLRRPEHPVPNGRCEGRARWECRLRTQAAVGAEDEDFRIE